jgi:hypothetical protein
MKTTVCTRFAPAGEDERRTSTRSMPSDYKCKHAQFRPRADRRSLKSAGVAAIEFALVLPVLMLILLGIIDFGLMMYDKAMITNAAREAARAGIVLSNPRPTGAQIQLVATSYCGTNLLTLSGPSACTPVVTNLDKGGSPCQAFADRLQVEVMYAYDGPVLGLMQRDGIPLGGTTVMRCE